MHLITKLTYLDSPQANFKPLCVGAYERMDNESSPEALVLKTMTTRL